MKTSNKIINPDNFKDVRIPAVMMSGFVKAEHPLCRANNNISTSAFGKFNFIALILMIILTSLPMSYSQNTPETKMAFISGGYYTPVYTKKDEPKQKVNSFYMDVYAVTVGEYLSFLQSNPQWRKSNVKKLFADKHYLQNWNGDLEPGEDMDLKSPVTNVSWFAAKAYAEWKGKRLPTTAEWEYVASAGSNSPDGAADEKNIKKVLQWYSERSTKNIAAVGTTGKNYWKVYDITGLIWEWTYDFNNALVTGESREDNTLNSDLFCGSGSANAKDVRNYPTFMRYGFRSSLKANYTVHNLGFRCVKDVQKILEAKK